jgi:Tfp pilus assembly protein PilF
MDGRKEIRWYVVRFRQVDVGGRREEIVMKWQRLFSLLLTAFLLVAVTSCATHDRRATLQMPYDDRIRLASIYIQSGQADRAVPLLEDALLQDEGRPEAWSMLGEISYSEGDLDKAANHLQKALDEGGEDPVILNNLAWVEMGRKDGNRALALIDRALLLDPVPSYPYLDTRARILGTLERYGEALADAQIARNLVPDHELKAAGELDDLILELEGLASGETL